MTPAPPSPRARWTVYPKTAALVGLATALSSLAHPWLTLPDTAMLYLLVIMAAAARYGRGASVLASALSVATYDFFFVAPRYTFAVDDPRNLLTFLTMFGSGQVISALTLRIRRGELDARAREARTVALSAERSRLAEEARAASDAAHAEKLRSTLLSAVSHDLRTPLAAITGAATTLRDDRDSLDRAQRDDMVATICEEAERMERLIANLLDMTRLESGAVTVRREWVPLEEVVGSALTRLDAKLAGRAVKVALPDELPLVSVDPVLLEQLFFNLLENATKHTPAGVPLDVSARALDDGGVEVTVADRGPGLPAGGEGRVFERFFHTPTARGGTGVGLGLAIARGFAEAHGGTLTARPRDGGGAAFVLTLPSMGPGPSLPTEAV
jgi:K+-sensing histidine kinase KdpD